MNPEPSKRERQKPKSLEIPYRNLKPYLEVHVVISRVISRVTILIIHIRGLITLLITTPEPPSRP